LGLLSLQMLEMAQFLRLHRECQLALCEFLLGNLNARELFVADSRVLHFLLLHLDLLLNAVELALLETQLLRLSELAELTLAKQLGESLSLGLHLVLQVGKL